MPKKPSFQYRTEGISAMRPGESYDDWFRRTSPGAAGSMDAQNKVAMAPRAPVATTTGRTAANAPLNVATQAQIDTTRKASNSYKFKAAASSFGNKAAAVGEAAIPYASNIINAFRKPPRGGFAGDVPTIAGRRFTMDAARSQLRESYRDQTGSADRILDENTAAAVRGSALAGYRQGIGRIGEAEMDRNISNDMQVNQMNSHIGMYNKQARQQVMDDNTNRIMVGQSAASANVANAADKYITQKNNEQDRLTTLDAVRMYNLNDVAGVKARLAALVAKNNIGTEDDRNYIAGKTTRKFGGPLTRRGMRTRMTA